MLFLTLALIVCRIASSAAQRNVTLDDTDPAIVYSPGWEVQQPTPLDAGGNHKLAEVTTATARLTFTGVAVYYMSPLWPYPVTTQLQLDSQPPVLVDLRDPDSSHTGLMETVGSAVMWKAENLPNTNHTLLISVGAGQQYAIVDTIIYTALDAPPPPASSAQSTAITTPPRTTSSIPPSSSSTTPPGSDAASSTGSSSSSRVLPIALGTALGALGLIIVAVALWLCCRKRKRPESEDWTVASVPPQVVAPPPTGPFSPYQPHSQPHAQHTYNSVGSSYQQHPYGSEHSLNNVPRPDRNPQMIAVGALPVANAQHNAYYGGDHPTQQDFNPWVGLVQMPGQQPYQQQDPYSHQYPSMNSSSTRYAPTALSTITETSTPGTLGDAKSHLVPSPASFPSANLAYYTPPPEARSSIRLSYASDVEAGASVGAAYQQHHHQHHHHNGGAGQLWSQGSSTSGGTPSKLTKESRPLVAVNRQEEEIGAEGSRPPAYTPL